MRARTQVLKDLSKELDVLGKAKVNSKAELKAQLRDLGRITHQVIYCGKITRMSDIKTEYGKAKAEQYNGYFVGSEASKGSEAPTGAVAPKGK